MVTTGRWWLAALLWGIAQLAAGDERALLAEIERVRDLSDAKAALAA
jgi:hypothetical protein